MPVTVNTALAASPAYCGLFVTTPSSQARLTRTAAGLSSLKTLWTVNLAEFRVFVIVHWELPFAATTTAEQSSDSA
jgi:hypothetical protein